MRMTKKEIKKLSTTQKIFNRKDVFGFGKGGGANKKSMIGKNGQLMHHMQNTRLSKGQIEHLQKDDLYQMRKEELQKKAKERKQKLDEDNFLKINRDQMITNVS